MASFFPDPSSSNSMPEAAHIVGECHARPARRADARPSRWRHDESERDACAIIANVKKDGRPSHGNVKRTLEALARMGHRTGEVEGEGDGAGVQTDIPRERWAKRLEAASLRGTLVNRAQFTVAHVMIPHEHRAAADEIKRRALELFEESLFEVLVSETARVRTEALGPQARAAEPEFWQVAALPRTARGVEDRDIFSITLRLERELPVHVASLSPNSVIYKVRGDAETLRRYFPELSHPDFKSAISLGHGRYSTNTDSRPERAQMFSTLGHNGEINSVDRLGREALALGFQLPPRASDSQVLDRVVESFMFEYGLSLMNALEIVFPPVWSEIERFPPEVRELYRYWRRAFGAHAQGPAAIIARQADEIVFSSDALGLRPLWCGETEKEFFASSEKGVVPLEQMVRDPRPLAPGEKMGFLLKRGVGVEVFEYHELQRRALEDVRFQPARLNRRVRRAEDVSEQREPRSVKGERVELDERRLAAFGWGRIEEAEAREMAETGKEPISGLGWDGPLAALSQKRRNLADYFHERVAVVTNPAIDREREADHFSTRVFLGARPTPAGPSEVEQIELSTPLLFGGPGAEDEAAHAAAARATGQRTLAEVFALCETFDEGGAGETSAGALRAATLDTTYGEDETVGRALARIGEEAARLVRESGSSVLVLDDARSHGHARLGLDPHLALAAVDARLRDERGPEGVSPRRRTSLVLRAASLRNVHDLVFALGCGADAINPYALFDVAARGAESLEERAGRLVKTSSALNVGVEKVLSTMGIHELDGYGRLFASVGLAPDVEEFFGVANYCGSASRASRSSTSTVKRAHASRSRAASPKGRRRGARAACPASSASSLRCGTWRAASRAARSRTRSSPPAFERSKRRSRSRCANCSTLKLTSRTSPPLPGAE
jgi:glutamate synthase (NADPH/NADH) large chain